MESVENGNIAGEEMAKGQQCRKVRKKLGLTQGKFAIVLNVSKNAVSDWEIGKYEPSDRHWRIIRLLDNLEGNIAEALQLALVNNMPLCPECRKTLEEYLKRWFEIMDIKKIEKE